MKLGLINSAWLGSPIGTAEGIRKTKEIGFDTIDIFAEGKALKTVVMSVVTDSTPVEEPKNPETCNVFALYSLFATDGEKAALAERYRAG